MATTKKTGEIQSPDVLKLISVAGLLAKYADRNFNAEISISQTQFAVLLAVDSTKPPVIQSDVSARLQRGLNTVSMLVDRMVQQGLLDRTRSKEDRRENILTLTPEGKQKLTRGKKVNESLNSQVAKMVGEKEVRALHDILVALEAVITNETG
jgi:MarR family transcriptional regulator, organic hydroperoxide resistance regulator